MDLCYTRLGKAYRGAPERDGLRMVWSCYEMSGLDGLVWAVIGLGYVRRRERKRDKGGAGRDVTFRGAAWGSLARRVGARWARDGMGWGGVERNGMGRGGVAPGRRGGGPGSDGRVLWSQA